MVAALTVTSQNKMARPPRLVMAVRTVTATRWPATAWLRPSTTVRSKLASGGQPDRTSSRSTPKPVAAAIDGDQAGQAAPGEMLVGAQGGCLS